MPGLMQAYHEAYKRGLLQGEQLAAYEEAQKRGIFPAGDLERAGYSTVGGAVGGAVAAGGGQIPPLTATMEEALTIPAGIGLGSAIGGQVYDIKEHLTGGKQFPANPVKPFKVAAEDFMMDMILPPALVKAGDAAKSLVGKPLQKGYRAMSKSRLSPRADQYDKFTSVGVKPTAADVTQSRALASAENSLQDYFFSAPVYQKIYEHNLSQLAATNKYLAKEYGDILSTEEVGLLLKRAAPESIKRLKGVYNKLFSRVAKEIPEPAPLSNTMSYYQQLAGKAEQGPASGVLKEVEDILVKGGDDMTLPWKALKRHRTRIGELTYEQGTLLHKDMKGSDLEGLYAALTKDMEAAALKAGPKTHARWRAANKYFETKNANDILILKEIYRKGYSDDIFNTVWRTVKAGPQRLNALKKRLKPNEWEKVQGTFMDRMGKSTPGGGNAARADDWTVQRFLGNWNRMKPSARQILWGGPKGLPADLKKFVDVVGDFEAVEKMANRSRTASSMMFYSLMKNLPIHAVGGLAGAAQGDFTGAAIGVAGTVGLTAIPKLTAKLMTNQKFVRWLSKGVQIAKTSPNDMGVHMGRLFALDFKEDVRSDLDPLLDAWLDQMEELRKQNAE